MLQLYMYMYMNENFDTNDTIFHRTEKIPIQNIDVSGNYTIIFAKLNIGKI